MLLSTPETVKGWYWEANTLGTQIHTVACGLTLALCTQTCIRPENRAQNDNAPKLNTHWASRKSRPI